MCSEPVSGNQTIKEEYPCILKKKTKLLIREIQMCQATDNSILWISQRMNKMIDWYNWWLLWEMFVLRYSNSIQRPTLPLKLC